MQSIESRVRLVEEVRLITARVASVWHLVASRYRYALGVAAALMAVTSAANIGVAVLLGKLVDTISSKAERSSVIDSAINILFMLALIYVSRELLHVMRRMLVENSCTRLNQDLQLKVVDHVMHWNMQSLGQEKVGTLHGKIFRSVDGLVHFVRLTFLDFAPAVFTGLFAIVAATCKQPWLGLTMLGVIPASVYLTLRQLSNQKGVRLKLMRDCEEIDGTLVEQLSGAEYIRVSNTVRNEMNRLSESMERRRGREVKHHFAMSLFGCAKALNEIAFHIIVLGIATYMAVQGTIHYGDVLAFSVLFMNVMSPLNEIHRVIDEGHESSLRIADLQEMLNKPKDFSFSFSFSHQTRHEPTVLNIRSGEPLIEFSQCSAGYATTHDVSAGSSNSTKARSVLRNVSLSIQHGQTIGIAGRSGSGKSTWLKVLLRLVHAHAGTVKLAGRDLHQVTREELAEWIGYVGQNPFVFSGTIADNISYGCCQRTQAEIERAAKAANIHEEIMSMPAGYSTHVTERGNNLSGGQRQRLAIARLLLRETPILILDEATSALDNISERCVQRALGVAAGTRTTILVAHRLSTLRDCDCIYVFDDGEIVESGSYESLLLSSGLFADLVYSAEQGVASAITEAG